MKVKYDLRDVEKPKQSAKEIKAEVFKTVVRPHSRSKRIKPDYNVLDAVLQELSDQIHFKELTTEAQQRRLVIAAEEVIKEAKFNETPFYLTTIYERAGTTPQYMDDQVNKDLGWQTIINHYKTKIKDHLTNLAMAKKIDGRVYNFYMINHFGMSYTSEKELQQRDRELDIKEKAVDADTKTPNTAIDFENYVKAITNAT